MDFIETYRKWLGKSEAPAAYVEWCALSLIAACIGNRVWLPYKIGNREMKKYGNLYCMLVGPSGNFKSYAIDSVEEVLRGVELERRINIYRGHITNSGMYDAMRTVRRKKNRKTGEYETVDLPHAGQMYLLQDEIASDIGNIEYADALIRALTKMYHGGVFDDATRTNGHVHLEGYSINWLSGSTLDWLVLSVSPATLNGGFFGRTVIVHSDYSEDVIYPGDIQRPANWDSMYAYLTGRVDSLLGMRGPVRLTPAACAVDREWYLTRVRPTAGVSDPTMQSSRRQHDLSLKLALLLALSAEQLEVDDECLARAQEMTNQVVKWQRQVLPSIQKGSHGTPQEVLLEAICGASNGLTHNKLYEASYRRFGMRAASVDDLVRTWQQAGMIVESKRNGTTYYEGVANVERKVREAAAISRGLRK